MAIFFSTLPLTILYGSFVAYTSSVTQMQGVTAESVRATLKIAGTGENYNSILWAVLATIVYLVLLFCIVIFLCRPLAKVENATEKLGNGRTKFDDFKFGGGRQFKEIEHSVNKINYNSIEKNGGMKKSEIKNNAELKRLGRFLGKDALNEIESGNQIRKNCSLMLCQMKNFDDGKVLDLEESYNITNSYLKLVLPLVKKHNGIVDKYLLDGVFVVFEHPQDAVNCASAILQTAKPKNKASNVNVETKIVIDCDFVLFGISAEKDKKLCVVSGEIERLEKIQKINDFIGTKLLLSKSVLNELPQNFKFDFRFVGEVSLDEKRKLPLYESLCYYDKHKKAKLKKLKNKFESAIQCYGREDFVSAKEMFSSILRIVSDDKPAYVYFNNCVDKLKEAA